MRTLFKYGSPVETGMKLNSGSFFRNTVILCCNATGDRFLIPAKTGIQNINLVSGAKGKTVVEDSNIFFERRIPQKSSRQEEKHRPQTMMQATETIPNVFKFHLCTLVNPKIKSIKQGHSSTCVLILSIEFCRGLLFELFELIRMAFVWHSYAKIRIFV